MEPLSPSINDSAINSKYDYILNSSSVWTIPLVRCDDPVFNRPIVKIEYNNDQVFNRVIKQENIDVTDHNNDQLLTGSICHTEEKVNEIETNIKVEKDFIECFEFGGSVLNKSHSSELMIHNDSNLTEKPLTLNVCNNELSNLSKFPVDKILQNGDNHYQCNTCYKLFPNLTKHLKIHTIKRKEPFICAICDKSYNNKSYLKIHIMFYNGEKQYKCAICDKGLSLAISLQNHTRTYTGEKSYQCDKCSKSYSRKMSLRTHIMRIHTREVLPYKCDVCDKSFARKDTLRIHNILIHTGENSSPICCFFLYPFRLHKLSKK